MSKPTGVTFFKAFNPDAFPEGPIEIWYYKPDYAADIAMGSSWLNKKGMMPTVKSLATTHVRLGSMPYPKVFNQETDRRRVLASVFATMQGEGWSPKGEAWEIIEAWEGHTSMGIGDVIHFKDTDEWFMVDYLATFTRLKP